MQNIFRRRSSRSLGLLGARLGGRGFSCQMAFPAVCLMPLPARVEISPGDMLNSSFAVCSNEKAPHFLRRLGSLVLFPAGGRHYGLGAGAGLGGAGAGSLDGFVGIRTGGETARVLGLPEGSAGTFPVPGLVGTRTGGDTALAPGLPGTRTGGETDRPGVGRGVGRASGRAGGLGRSFSSASSSSKIRVLFGPSVALRRLS